jgi:hypothetical protein
MAPSFYRLRWSLTNFLPGLASNCEPPDLHLCSSWDYRHEPPHPLHKVINTTDDNAGLAESFSPLTELHNVCMVIKFF